MGIIINHYILYIRTPSQQPVQWKVGGFFFVAHVILGQFVTSPRIPPPLLIEKDLLCPSYRSRVRSFPGKQSWMRLKSSGFWEGRWNNLWAVQFHIQFSWPVILAHFLLEWFSRTPRQTYCRRQSSFMNILSLRGIAENLDGLSVRHDTLPQAYNFPIWFVGNSTTFYRNKSYVQLVKVDVHWHPCFSDGRMIP